MNRPSNEWTQLLEERDVLQKGHFLLSSGQHSAAYLQCARLFQQPQDAERVGSALAEHFQEERIDTVVGPAMGGVIPGHETARALGCRAVFTERENNKMTFRRGFHVEKGERVLVVEDVVTTGGSVKEVLAVLEEVGADIVGIASVVDRSDGESSLFDYPFNALARIQIDTYAPEHCPLCAEEAGPAVKPGSRK